MNSQRVHFLVDFAIHEGKLDDFASVATQLTAGTAREAGALEYEWFLNDDHSCCRLLETYANPDAAQAHLAGAEVKELIPKLLAFGTIRRFEVYGDPDVPTEATLASFGAEIYRHWQGFASQPPGTASSAAD